LAAAGSRDDERSGDFGPGVAYGTPDGWLWTLAGLRRGELWETTAVRELRDQAAIVAAGVCASLAQPADAPVAVPA
jgi:hypothetical protein